MELVFDLASKDRETPLKPAEISLEYRLLCHLQTDAAISNNLQRFFTVEMDESWAESLEFAVCQSGATWLLSIFRPVLFSVLSEIKWTAKPTSASSKSTLPKLPLDVQPAVFERLSESDRQFLNSKHGTLLFLCALDAAESHLRQEAQLYIQRIASLPVTDKTFVSEGNDENPLMYSAVSNRADFVSIINQVQPNISQDRLGEVLKRAAISGSAKSADALISLLHAPVDWDDHYGATSCYYAARYGNLATVRALAQRHHANVDAVVNDGRTALHAAAMGGNLEIITALMCEFGLSANARDHFGKTSLHWAADHARPEVVRRLISLRGDPTLVTKDGRSILMQAAMAGDPAMIEMLVSDYKLAVDQQDSNGSSSCYFAARIGNLDAVRALVKMKADLNHVSKEGQTVLHAAAEGGDPDNIVALVSEFGVSPNAKDDIGTTPMHQAAEMAQLEALRSLISLRGDPSLLANVLSAIPFIR